jgi:HSP20 family protein
MNDPMDPLARLQRQLGGIASQVTQVQFTYTSAERWRPSVNAYRCGDRFIICVDLAGADQSATQVVAEPHRLIIRGERPPPGPPCDGEAVQVLEMEIDYGPFERVIELPAEIHPNHVKAEYREGLLWVDLPLRGL